MNDRRANILFAILIVAPFVGCFASGLFDLDEGYYAAVTSEMVRRHEWITPYYNGSPWFEKPILLYWCAKLCVLGFGPSIGMRLPSVLASLGTIALVFDFARRRFDLATARLAAMILATSLLFVIAGRLMLTDPLLVMAFTGAMTTFWDSVDGMPNRRLWTAFFLGLGVLAKGPVAILLFVPIAAITYWRLTDIRGGFRGGWLLGTVILVAVTSTWYVPAYLAQGQVFVQKFLIEQNIGRFTGGDAAHTVGLVSLPLYVIVLLVGMAPWSIAGFAALWRGLRERSGIETYLAIWATVILCFFTISSAKLPHYILPCAPPLALLAARRLEGTKWAFKTAIALAPVLAIGLTIIQNLWYVQSGQAEAHRLAALIRRDGRSGDVALYQLSRRERERATGTANLQETSLPSLIMVLDAEVLDTESLSDIFGAHKRLILTRVGRITDADRRVASERGYRLDEWPSPEPYQNFIVYEVNRAVPSGRPLDRRN